MILLHTIPYLRQKDHFTSADKFGSWVACQDIVRAALQYGSVEGVHFYLPFIREYSKEELPQGIEELRQDFPHHQIEFKQLSELQELAQKHRYVLADDFEIFSPLAFSRHTGEKCLFPIAAIVHTIPRHGAFIGYSSVQLLAEEFDAVVTTSEAGNRAIRAIFEDMEEFIASRLETDFKRKVNIAHIPLAVDEQFLSPFDSQNARRRLRNYLKTLNNHNMLWLRIST